MCVAVVIAAATAVADAAAVVVVDLIVDDDGGGDMWLKEVADRKTTNTQPKVSDAEQIKEMNKTGAHKGRKKKKKKSSTEKS